MKNLMQAALLLLLPVIVPAQVADIPAAPGVVVVEKDWRKIIRNPALDDDPLRAGRETIIFEQEKRETARVNQVLRDLGRDQIPPPTRSSSGIRIGNPSVSYVYEAKIRNTGTKTLKTVVWRYAFWDAEKNEEVGRTSCVSKVNLRPGKTADLVGTSRTAPIRVVDVTKSGKELKGLYLEQVVITRLEYTDGTFWQRPVD